MGRMNDDLILDSNAISPTDAEGRPIPVTIPIALAPGVTVVYTTRLGGVSSGPWGDCNLGGKSGDDPAHVLANRTAVAQAVGVPLSLVEQVHSGTAIDVDGIATPNAPFGFDASGTKGVPGVTAIQADGQVTSRTGVALGMFAADCLPVLLADPQAGVIGAAHCGRRGLQRGIVASTVALMREKGAEPSRIVATLGPAICGDCYETGGDIADDFDAQFPGSFTLTRFGGPGVDLNAAALAELEGAGIPRDNIVASQPRVLAATQYLDHDAELEALCASDGEGGTLDERLAAVRHSMCTLENPLWYSHRRSALAGHDHEGRMLALIVRQ
ncbi:laccase domain-containing protein [Bifidobacterium pullorum subsp. saeculare]|uniref:Laccase domain-containing protein n=1 Tax=Bifidobacterium pullorum subsp. saeculare TaxID=78257 RepID=A0A939BAC8_9BIFI|nr:polyphenol oxidase family protein [Bifidobacterium pullorum]MBM6700384.1 laccase domain-containing protein [Bifidobacterium pullorum subsp. saeculare]